MYFSNLAGLIALLFISVIMLLAVPLPRIQRLFPLGSVFGTIFGSATYYLMQNVWSAWRFQNVDLYSIGNIPLLLTLAWIPYSITYFHYLAQYQSKVLIALLIITAAAVPSFFHFLLDINGMVLLGDWAWWNNFLYAATIYTLTALVYWRVFPTERRHLNRE